MAARTILPTLQGYRRSWLAVDVAAGVTLAAIAIPEQLATARLANMPALTGLYTFVAATVAFAVLGRATQMSVGADSTIAPVMATGVAAVAATGSARYVTVMAALALVTGALVAAAGALRLGWIADFLSTPVITGVLLGIAVQIAIRQLPAVLGLPGGGTTSIGRLSKVSHEIGHVRALPLVIAATVLALIFIGERVDRRIPAALIALVAAAVIAGAAHLGRHGVALVGPVQGGVADIGWPVITWQQVGRLLPTALTVAFVCVAQTAATTRENAGAPVAGDFNRDLIAVGAGSVLSGLSGGFAVNASPPRSAILTAAGGRTQVACLVAAAAATGVTSLAAGLVSDLPEAALGALLLFVATRLARPAELRAIMRFDRLELALALVTAVVVATAGIEDGVVVALILSLADRTRRAARPRDVLLGREPGTDHWIPTDIGKPTEQVPGVVVYLIYAPLWYGNADFVRLRIRQIVGSAPHPVRALVLDADAVADIDYTGAQVLSDAVGELKRAGVEVLIARSSHLVHHDLKHSGLLESLGPERIFATVEEAVRSASGQPTT